VTSLAGRRAELSGLTRPRQRDVDVPPHRPGPAISFAGVTKRYGPVVALDGVSFAIEPGEMVALLGPNGAGKSTTVDVLLGLRLPDGGAARVLGLAPRQATGSGQVGAMLQAGSLPDRALVSEVVELARRLYRSGHSLAGLLELAGLSDLARRRTDRLSGGQARRVQLAVALAGDPRVLFLDEPTTGLDVGSRRLFWDGVRRAAASGATVLFATHYLEEADANAGRVLVLAGGRLVADGGPAQIKAQLTGQVIRAVMHPAALSRLRALPGVLSAAVDGEQVELRTADPDATLHGMYACGAAIASLRIDGASLEDALIHLTTPPAGPGSGPAAAAGSRS
jgi:ABC-2 type transport system ATP-binding protein